MQTGKIAHELQFVDHKIRTKLDELKREELERLRHLATKEYNLVNGLDMGHLKIAEHLDHANTNTFEIDDLKKLIAKVKQLRAFMQLVFMQSISSDKNICILSLLIHVDHEGLGRG